VDIDGTVKKEKSRISKNLKYSGKEGERLRQGNVQLDQSGGIAGNNRRIKRKNVGGWIST